MLLRKVARVESSLLYAALGKSRLEMAVWRPLPLHWHRCQQGQDASAGIVAVTAWMLSGKRQVGPYLRTYASCGWDTLTCHPPVSNLWLPGRAHSLAVLLLEELAREVEARPRPIVFAAFSGGAKACLYQVFRILLGVSPDEEEESHRQGRFAAVRACVAGQVHDSSPPDFVSQVGAKFVSHSLTPGFGPPPPPLYWMARAGGWVADAVMGSRFERQRQDYWNILRGSAALGPLLLLCSRADALVPFATVAEFAAQMEQRGCKVTLVAWPDSAHVAHLRRYPREYTAAVTKFLTSLVVPAQEEETGATTTELEQFTAGPHAVEEPGPQQQLLLSKL